MIAEDIILAKKVSDGDEEAFLCLYESNYKKVYYHVKRFVGDAFEAEDLTQEVFIKAFRFIGTYAGTANLSSWLKRIATNVCIDHMRKKSLQTIGWPDLVSKEGDGQPAEFRDETVCVPEVVESSETKEELMSAIAQLPPYYRDVVVLCDVMDLSGEAASREISRPVGTVKSRLSRAHGLLRSRYLQGQAAGA